MISRLKHPVRAALFGTALVALPFLSACWAANDTPLDGDDTQMIQKSDDVVLFDFQPEDATLSWRTVNDTVMGGVSSSRFEYSQDGTAVFSGTVSLENNGGFASVRGPRIERALGEFQGITLRVRGEARRYKCTLRTDGMFDGVSHQAAFETAGDEWQTVRIPFTEFVPTWRGRQLSDDQRMTPDKVRSVGFQVSDKQEGPFLLEIDWIAVYS